MYGPSFFGQSKLGLYAEGGDGFLFQTGNPKRAVCPHVQARVGGRLHNLRFEGS
jgi:hypothetical protein